MSLTNQQIFNRVINHLRKQGKPSMGWQFATPIGVSNLDPMICLYRNPNGLKCAIGCLIEDREYSPLFESNTIDSLFDYRPKFKNFSRRNYCLLDKLQGFHDMQMTNICNTDEDLIASLKILAKHFRLKYKPRKGFKF